MYMGSQNNWILCSDRMPTKEEYLKDDGRFIVSDGQRVYQSLYDIYEFMKFCEVYYDRKTHQMEVSIDRRVIMWQPMPNPDISINKGERSMKIEFDFDSKNEMPANWDGRTDKKEWDKLKKSYLDKQGKLLLQSLEKGLIKNNQYKYPMNEILYNLLDKTELMKKVSEKLESIQDETNPELEN